ncbi:uncharacterized protein F4807DRAFT_439769 [Annulohypoxylon truncatum]|uniref:uncharacterized protein n=1 Tax=Annulohypoxylon truncatum TaxID=327061 RepID=UPI002008581F|nr:uncharacterized protein F4807DRAFT_439769 [Annulohypoxylon truncatum]KAI1206351.1 hypothetical protein F4807DRAFT_439769 [Annulohypoxylon truncatum]
MSSRPKSKQYTAVHDEETACLSEAESTENFLSDNQRRNISPSTWIPQGRCNAAGFILGVACLVVTILVTIQCTIWYERRGSNAPRWRPAFSPLYDMVKIPLITTYSEHSPAPNVSDPRHIYRLDPSPEVDAAWSRIATADGVYPMSASDVVRAGKDPKLAVDAPESWGFPPGKSKMMGIEAFHLLHCLNALRKSLITTYDYYWGAKYGFQPPAIYERHLNHCVEMLRQHLMCHADLEPFTFNWREGQAKPYADFNIQKTCVDFDYLLEWSERNKDPRHEELWRALEKPEDALQKEAPADLPQITEDTVWSASGKTPLANLTGFEGKEYCLGTRS